MAHAAATGKAHGTTKAKSQATGSQSLSQATTRYDTPPGTSTSSGTSIGSNPVEPLCQPMPVSALLRMMDSVPAVPAAVSEDSTAMLRAMHDYISGVLRLDLPQDPVATFTTGPSPWQRLVVSPRTLRSKPLTATSATQGIAPGPSASTTPATGSPMQRATAAAMLQASQRMAAALQKFQPGQAVELCADTASGHAASSREDVPGNSERWAQELALMQTMLAEGLPESEAEFVSKLSSELLDQPASLSAGAVTAGAMETGEACAASGVIAAAVPERPRGSLHGVALSYQNGSTSTVLDKKKGVQEGSNAASDAGVAPRAVEIGPERQSECGSKQGEVVQCPFVTKRVAPFIIRPYQLLQELHATAQRYKGKEAASSTTSSHAAGGGDVHQGPPVDTATTEAAGDAVAAADTSVAPGAHPPPSPSPPLVRAGDYLELVTMMSSTDSTGAGAEKGEQAFEAAVSSADLHEHTAASALAPKLAHGEHQGVSAQWKSVLDILVNAGPQVIQPESPYPGGSSVWDSTQSSNEHDSASYRSEDATAGEGASAAAAAVAAAVTTATTGKKSKRKRAKRSKAATR
jgi:hypothetical protein